jgi:signal transduction histidine kinase
MEVLLPRAFLVSLWPIVGVSIALVGIVLMRSPRRWGLAGVALAVAAWALSLLLSLNPDTQALGERLLMVGFYVPVGFLVAAREARVEVEADEHRVGPAWAVPATLSLATLVFVVGLVRPHTFLADGGATPGPLFAPMFILAAVLSTWPLVELARGLSAAREGGRERLRYLLLAGLLCCFGGGINVLLLLLHRPSPLGLTMALCGVGLLAWAVRTTHLPAFGRFVEGSLRYSVAAAVLTTGYLFAVLVFLRPPETDAGWGLGAAGTALQLFVLVLVGQPFLAGGRQVLLRRLFPQQSDVAGLARALAESEARAEHAERLAEIGTLASAVAHEVRNPLGVIAAATLTLERSGGDATAVAEIRAQVHRAATFADELLAYGRPAPLSRRPVDLAAAAELAASEVTRAIPLDPSPEITVEGEAPPVSADLSQIIRLIGILIENAVLAVHESPTAGRVRVRIAPRPDGATVTVEDDGPGVAPALRASLFQPFASGRGRGGPRPGTGLGLAIANGIAERHGGHVTLDTAPGPLGGALFRVDLPTQPRLPPADGAG